MRKKGLVWLLAAALLLAVFGCAPDGGNAGSSVSDPEDCYTYAVLDDGTAEITGYHGNDARVVIPSDLDGRAVTAIGYDAFRGLELITSVTIPQGVTVIEDCAFLGCVNLTDLQLPDGLRAIHGNAFESCDSLTHIVLPDSVTTIGEYAFYSCRSLPARGKRLRIVLGFDQHHDPRRHPVP